MIIIDCGGMIRDRSHLHDEKYNLNLLNLLYNVLKVGKKIKKRTRHLGDPAAPFQPHSGNPQTYETFNPLGLSPAYRACV